MDDLTKGLIEHLRKNGSDITVREPPQFLAAKDFHPIPREETMTIKKTMRMTIEQEQLICKIATQLQEADLLQFYYWQQAYERSEEHTSELQSHSDLVCRLLLEK